MPPNSSARVTRDLEILRGLADAAEGERSGIGVVALATRLGRDKGQVSRALSVLASSGLVERDDETGRYHLGLELYALAARTAQSRLLRTAPLVLRPLAVNLSESVHLCALHGRDVLTLRSYASPAHTFRASGWEGRVVPAHATSAGRVLLSDQRPEEIRLLFEGFDVRTPGPDARVRSIEDLIAVISAARRAGYATVSEEFERDLVGASAPVRNMNDDIVAAINVSAELGHPRDLDAVGRACAVAAARLSRLLGAPVRQAAPRLPAVPS